MLPIEQLKQAVSYDPETGTFTRRKSGKPVYLDKTNSGPRMEVYGYKIYARKVALAFILGRYPKKHEFRFIGKDKNDLRPSAFRRRYFDDGTKACGSCGCRLPPEEFHRNPQRKDKRNTTCKQCLSKHNKKHNRKSNLNKYGLDEDSFAKMSEEQDHKCKICGTEAADCRYGVLVVDHCHETGDVRGLLCPKCNTGIGLLKDDPRVLANAVKYLLKKL